MDTGGWKEPFRPYVSKRKRKAQQQEASTQKKPFVQQYNMKEIFLTNDVVYNVTQSLARQNASPSLHNRSFYASECPLWSVKWCKKFGHLIACTSKKSVNLIDVMKGDICVWSSFDDPSQFKDLDWSKSCRQLAGCNFDKKLKVWDFLDGGKLSCTIRLDIVPSVIKYWPEEDNLLIVGGESSFLATYDLRSGKLVTKYSSPCGNIMSIEVLSNSGYFISSGDSVNEVSSAYSLIIWDFATGAKISNQIFHEKFSCPKVCVHPSGTAFLAQTNGNYAARFSTVSPFRLDKYLRYDKHKVDGFPIGLDISPDGRIVASGSCDGSVVFYKYTDSSVLRTLDLSEPHCDSRESNSAGISLQWHPNFPTMVAVGDWSGKLHILK